MCRCAERREAIGRAVGAAVRGDVSAVKAAAGFVLRSGAEDARLGAAAAARLAAARLRLGKGNRSQ